jgi:hypothetical protein
MRGFRIRERTAFVAFASAEADAITATIRGIAPHNCQTTHAAPQQRTRRLRPRCPMLCHPVALPSTPLASRGDLHGCRIQRELGPRSSCCAPHARGGRRSLLRATRMDAVQFFAVVRLLSALTSPATPPPRQRGPDVLRRHPRADVPQTRATVRFDCPLTY